MKHKLPYFLAFLCSLLFTSCKVNYSMSGASISPEIKTLTINYFPVNATLAPPVTGQKFTEALRDIFQTQTSLKLLPKNGDLLFSGSITGYTTMPLAVQGNSSSITSVTNRLTMTVNVKFQNIKDEKQNFESTFSRFADYSSSSNLADVQDKLIKEINEQLVQDVFNKSVTNW